MEFDPDQPAPKDGGLFGLSSAAEDSAVWIVPVPFEATVSYGHGAAKGPELVLQASHQVDLFDLETGQPYRSGIYLQSVEPSFVEMAEQAKRDARAGRVERVNEASARMNDHVLQRVRAGLAQNKIMGVLGGDHSVALGSIKAHAERFGSIGVLQFDAHADLRVAYEGYRWSHASVMERALEEAPSVARLVQIGVRDLGVQEHQRIQEDPKISALFDHDLVRARMEGRLLQRFQSAVEALPELVYCSFDIDGLDPKLCPGTGMPVPGGLSIGEASALLGMVVRSGRRIIGFDLCEVAGSEWDGNVGARALYKLIGWSLRGP